MSRENTPRPWASGWVAVSTARTAPNVRPSPSNSQRMNVRKPTMRPLSGSTATQAGERPNGFSKCFHAKNGALGSSAAPSHRRTEQRQHLDGVVVGRTPHEQVGQWIGHTDTCVVGLAGRDPAGEPTGDGYHAPSRPTAERVMVESMVSTRQAARALALRGLKVTAAAADRVRPPGRGVVFLAYHCVGAGTGLEIDLEPAAFDEQMAALAELGTVVEIDAGLAALAGPAPDGPDPVVVTFDDGTSDFAEHAAPILERHRIPATLYLATDFVERQVPYAYGARPLTWAALRDACASGLVTVGSHTHTHAVMDAVDGPTADDELGRSVALIEEHLGRPAEHFAYPKGVAGTPEADAVVRRRFRSAALAVVATNPYGTTDPYRLARSPIQVSDGQRWFEHKVAGGMAFEGTLRHLLNRRRYAGLTT